MWPHNSFGINGPYPNGFNQDEYMYPTNFQHTNGSLESHFPGTKHDVLIGMSASNSQNNQGFEKNGFQADMESFNQSTFDVNPQVANPIVQCAPRPLSAVQNNNLNSRPSAPQISSRAAELKAQLLARRANSSNSPSGKPNSKTDTGVNVNGARQEKPETANSARQSPSTPLTIDKQDQQQLNLNDLISQYSASKSKSEKKKEQENSNVNSGKPKTPGTAHPQESGESQTPSNKNIPSVNKAALITKKKSNHKLNGKDHSRKVETKVSDPETSEGEIIEGESSKSSNTKNLKEIDVSKSFLKDDEKSSCIPSRDQTTSLPQDPSPQEKPAVHYLGSQTQKQGISNSKTSENDLRLDDKKHPVPLGPKADKRSKHVSDRHSQSRREANVEVIHNSEVRAQPSRPESSRQKPLPLREQEPRPVNPPTLEDLLPHDVDVREWLDITGYHNKPYRDKILGRRRAIAALDAQREKLIAEIEAEERGGIPVVVPTQPFSSSMLPPPIPNYKTGDRIGTISIAKISSPIPHERQQIASNKRSHSSSQDSWQENGPGKIARTDSTNYSPRNKEEQSFDSRRPRSSDREISNRSVQDRQDDYSRPCANNNRDSKTSPSSAIFERKSPARVGGYEIDPYDEEDISENGNRSFELQGNHRGRAIDTKSRGRGRARGRSDIRDSRDSPELRNEGSSSFKNTNGRPNKNVRGASRGSRGNH
ncbi:hypothetical protein GcC1_175029 [Golovinomyces cichoracearum]|uniref:Uncharacterized protein n=1 Tax=Golovinomyces cichoracearum TaxID=62708 RepID=A0A420HPL5_9PEZI|nr:hypothetical protein GcC1_175029 [Golovinomyces cichoracearum]